MSIESLREVGCASTCQSDQENCQSILCGSSGLFEDYVEHLFLFPPGFSGWVRVPWLRCVTETSQLNQCSFLAQLRPNKIVGGHLSGCLLLLRQANFWHYLMPLVQFWPAFAKQEGSYLRWLLFITVTHNTPTIPYSMVTLLEKLAQVTWSAIIVQPRSSSESLVSLAFHFVVKLLLSNVCKRLWLKKPKTLPLQGSRIFSV